MSIKSSDGSFVATNIYPLGSYFETRYIHSVQKTPVEDRYLVLSEEIWLSEERVISHNAGLPSERPRCGYFYRNKDWMFFLGGRIRANSFFLRVGDQSLGQNELKLESKGRWIELYTKCPGKRCVVKSSFKPLISSLFYK